MARYQEALLALAQERPEVVVMTAENRAAIRDLPESLGPRFVDVGICEQTLVGAAAGLALRGRIPVVHGMAAFLTMRAFEFIRTDVGLAGLPVKLVGYAPGVLSEANGPTHQAIEDVALMRGVPGMQVFCPADEDDLAAALPGIVASPGPCYVRFNAALPGWARGGLPGGGYELIGTGDEVTILSYGVLARQAVEAARQLSHLGVPARAVSLRFLQPLDEEALLRLARPDGLVVTLEDHRVAGGLATLLAELLLRRGQTRRLLAIGFESASFRAALLPDVLEHEGLSALRVVERVLRVARPERRSKGVACPIE